MEWGWRWGEGGGGGSSTCDIEAAERMGAEGQLLSHSKNRGSWAWLFELD